MVHKHVVFMPDKLLLIEMANGDFKIGGQYGSVRRYSQPFKTQEEAEANGRFIRTHLKICNSYSWAV